jgi:integrase
MSVRRLKRRDPITGQTRERWMVDVDFEHADGRRERVRKISPVQTRHGAEEYERQVRAALLDPRRRRPPAPTFREFVTKRWWPTYPDAAGNRERTKREKEGHLRLYLRPAFDDLPIDAIDGEKVERLFATLAARNISAKTRQNVRATLRRILASAVEWGVIDALPYLPSVRVPMTRTDFLSHVESDRLVAAARNDAERALLLFALHTGARASEQLALEWRDVDFANEQVIIRRAFSLGVAGPPKSGRERTVPLSATLAKALGAIRHARSALVFCSADGRRSRSGSSMTGSRRRAVGPASVGSAGTISGTRSRRSW